jgi:peptidoglycan/LPS O-acetylase OafA/YrhL
MGSAAWAGYLHTTAFNRTIGFLFAPIWFSYIIFWLIQFRGSHWTLWLRNPLLTYLGKVSYAAYLFHWPVANILTNLAERLHMGWLNEGFARIGSILIVTFALSALSWHFFESPVQRMKDRLFPGLRSVRPA